MWKVKVPSRGSRTPPPAWRSAAWIGWWRLHLRRLQVQVQVLTKHQWVWPLRGRLLFGFRPGFLCDPGKVIGIPVCDRPRRDTGYLVGVLALCSGNDLGNPAAAGMQRHPALAALVDFAMPSVDRLDGREVVRAGA